MSLAVESVVESVVGLDVGLAEEVESAMLLACGSVHAQGEPASWLLVAVCPCGEVREDKILCAEHVGDWVLNFHEIAAAGIGWCGQSFSEESFTYSVMSLDM